MRHIYRGEIGEIKWRNARMSCAYALMAMRTKAGISRKMMAAALDILLGVFSSIEMANNEKIHMPALLKYVEVTGLPFKVSTVPKKRKPGTSRKK